MVFNEILKGKVEKKLSNPNVTKLFVSFQNFLLTFKKITKSVSCYEKKNFEMKGGGKKRKKKTYTKPKKIKHIRKKIKLKTLNYYSVTDGIIKKLRKESPQSPGSFMAEHSDRLTCGKTGLTLVRKN